MGFGSATLLAAASGLGRLGSGGASWPVLALVVLALAVYVGSILVAVKAYGLYTYHRAPEPTPLLKHLGERESRTREVTVRAMARAVDRAAVAVERKAKWTRVGFHLLVVQAVLVAAIALARVDRRRKHVGREHAAALVHNQAACCVRERRS